MKIINPLLYLPIYNTATSVLLIAIEDIEVIKEDDSDENNESSSL